MMLRKTLNSLGLSFALVLAAVTLGNNPTQAQESGTDLPTTEDRNHRATGVYYYYREDDETVAQHSEEYEDNLLESKAVYRNMDTEAHPSLPVRGLW